MTIIETKIFTRQIVDLLVDDEYRALQNKLALRPESGDLIPSGGGLRKDRWPRAGSGKRGGLRIIYYWDPPSDTIYMLLAYAKSDQDDLTSEQIRVLRRIVREELS